MHFSIVVTAGLNVDLGPFFELAILMVGMSSGTCALLKINDQKII